MKRGITTIIVVAIIGIILIVALSSSIFFTVQPGERAVVFKKFSGGLNRENSLSPGFHFKAPWNTLYVYDITENKVEEAMDVLDKNGLSITVDVSVRFHPKHQKIGNIQETFGNQYVSRLVIPEVRSIVRQVMGRYTAEEIYSTKRSEVEQSIKSETYEVLGNEYNNIEMRAMLIRSIKLPPQIKEAIENKLKQEQEALAYQYRLEREKSEAERKRIEAKGAAEANRIINQSLTNNLLRMRGIEATTKLSESENAKVVVIGSGDDGLPVILGNQ